MLDNSEGKHIRRKLVTELDKVERRQGSLARLLQGHSECIALIFLNDKLLIAANEFHQNSKNNKYIRLITAVMGYFSDYLIPKQPIDETKRLKLLKSICYEKASSISNRSNISISQSMVDLIVDELTTDISLLDHPFKVSTYKADSAATALVVSEFKRIYRDFCKLEESIGDRKKTSPDLTYLFKSYTILKDAIRPGIHAEVQLLEKIVSEYEKGSDLPDIINIGISKLCCLNCRTMLQAANQVFFESNIHITLVFQGQHDLSFAWNSPGSFVVGYNIGKNSGGVLPSDEPLSISSQIGLLTSKLLESLLNQDKPTGISMFSPLSDSSPRTHSFSENDPWKN